MGLFYKKEKELFVNSKIFTGESIVRDFTNES